MSMSRETINQEVAKDSFNLLSVFAINRPCLACFCGWPAGFPRVSIIIIRGYLNRQAISTTTTSITTIGRAALRT